MTEIVTLFSDAAEPELLDVELGDFTLGYDGSLSFLPAGSLEVSAVPWIDLEADTVEVPVAGERPFRFTVEISGGATPEGTYHGMIFFATQPTAAPDMGPGVRVRNRLALPVYVTVLGTLEPSGDIVDFYPAAEQRLEIIIQNDGNTSLRPEGTIDIRDATGTSVVKVPFPGGVVLRGTERAYSIPLPDDLPPGFYVALALIEDEQVGLLPAELPFEVSE